MFFSGMEKHSVSESEQFLLMMMSTVIEQKQLKSHQRSEPGGDIKVDECLLQTVFIQILHVTYVHIQVLVLSSHTTSYSLIYLICFGQSLFIL